MPAQIHNILICKMSQLPRIRLRLVYTWRSVVKKYTGYCFTNKNMRAWRAATQNFVYSGAPYGLYSLTVVCQKKVA